MKLNISYMDPMGIGDAPSRGTALRIEAQGVQDGEMGGD